MDPLEERKRDHWKKGDKGGREAGNQVAQTGWRVVIRLCVAVTRHTIHESGFSKKKSLATIVTRLLVINMAPTYSPAWYSSTIGHEGLNFSVRYGKR